VSVRAEGQFINSTWWFLHGWQSLDKLFSPESRPHTTTSGEGIPEMNQKGEPRTGY
jgi:hypothetical protein